MSLIHPFSAPPNCTPSPYFDSPFCNSPSPLAELAAKQLQRHMADNNWPLRKYLEHAKGQMFGVLVVQKKTGELGCLHGFSGTLADEWLVQGFVPPAFDLQRRQEFLPAARSQHEQMQAELQSLRAEPAFHLAERQLREARVRLSESTSRLQAELVERKAKRRLARAQATAAQLLTLQREGETDARRRAQDKRHAREEIARLVQAFERYAKPIERLSAESENAQRQIQTRLQAGYHIVNALGERAELAQLFAGRIPLPGVGDCAGPKLLHYAYSQGLRPVALAEFWWGSAPGEGVRHHGHFYPSCRGRCAPLLAFMLQGLRAGRQPEHLQPFADLAAPEIIFEDKHLLLVHKPAGQLSVPGLSMTDSVQSRLQARYPDLPELQLVHRLDQSTSGLLLVAKTRRDHKALQRQFSKRTITKQYIALLDGRVVADDGEIDLPLRVDLEDRPRQLVCALHGRVALTRWQLIAHENGCSRVRLFPVTGRTHQLRVHMAHAAGLGLPIVGDELYGRPGGRLHLHARSLSFIHPGSGERVSFSVPAPF